MGDEMTYLEKGLRGSIRKKKKKKKKTPSYRCF